tara:strand:+ start:3461 stop:4579 length:1119 start_codon:yes stop_codon:yes gene_type:complete
MKYIFHLGRDAELSILEVVSYLERTDRKYKILKITKRIFLIEIDRFDPLEAIICLGGTTKISAETKNPDEAILQKIASSTKNKLNYGINFFESSKTELKKVIEIIKTISKEQKIKALHKNSSERDIPPSKSSNLDLELTLFKNKVYVVSAVSDPKSYIKRDENRPYFHPLKVVSIRLAKILINLAQPKKNSEILDPFAGIGTILQEASLMGVKSTGIDKDQTTCKNCQKNLDWLKKNFRTRARVEIKRGDVKNLSRIIKSADCIATEPYLGPFIRKLPTEVEARETAKELAILYDAFLREASRILKRGSKMSIVVPTFKTKNAKLIRIGFQTLIKKHGFSIFQPLRNKLVPIDYVLKNSKIRRKIYILEKLK